MARPLPSPRTLSDAVVYVIESNLKDGYRPSRFIQATVYGSTPDLVGTCQRIIMSADAFAWMADKLRETPTLLTIEDLVARYGAGWGVHPDVIAKAIEHAASFDELVRTKRYE